MTLKLSILVNLLFVLLFACSWGSPRPRPVRDEKEKLYRACEDSEVAGTPIGRLCSRTCIKKEGTKCKEHKTTVKNFCEQTDFLFYRNGSFVFVPEKSI